MFYRLESSYHLRFPYICTHHWYSNCSGDGFNFSDQFVKLNKARWAVSLLTMQIPKNIINKIALTEDEFEQLSLKVQTCIIRLASENIELHDIIGDRIADRLKAVSLSTPIAFMVVGMRFYGSHKFSEDDVITLEKEDDNASDSSAIKVLVSGKKVGYVSKDYTKQLRDVPSFEQKKLKFLRNFPQSAKLEMIF